MAQGLVAGLVTFAFPFPESLRALLISPLLYSKGMARKAAEAAAAAPRRAMNHVTMKVARRAAEAAASKDRGSQRSRHQKCQKPEALRQIAKQTATAKAATAARKNRKAITDIDTGVAVALAETFHLAHNLEIDPCLYVKEFACLLQSNLGAAGLKVVPNGRA